jgi:hypothetical protein
MALSGGFAGVLAAVLAATGAGQLNLLLPLRKALFLLR